MARGLCLTHYKRERAGKPLVDSRPRRGDPDGFGAYGDLSDDGCTVQCHECGYRAASLGSHVVAAHEMSAREYKLAHGLPLTRGLTSRAERERRSTSSRESERGLAALDAHRDPAAASASRGAETWAAVGEQARLDPERARRNGTPEPSYRDCEVCGATWLPEPSRSQYRDRTCSAECYAILQSWRSRRRGTESRDARIVADVLRRGRSRSEVAAEYGITAERVGQIVRAHQRGDISRTPGQRA